MHVCTRAYTQSLTVDQMSEVCACMSDCVHVRSTRAYMQSLTVDQTFLIFDAVAFSHIYLISVTVAGREVMPRSGRTTGQKRR